MKKQTDENRKLGRASQKPGPGTSALPLADSEEARTLVLDDWARTIYRITGTQPAEVVDRIIGQLARAQVWPKPDKEIEQIIKSMAAISEMAPQNSTEARLAVQMIATHDAALAFLSRSTLPQQDMDAIDKNVLRATRLMRLHLEQIEAMQKLKGKAGQQRVTVEHVHVHQGGQAIVGAVGGSMIEPGGGGK